MQCLNCLKKRLLLNYIFQKQPQPYKQNTVQYWHSVYMHYITEHAHMWCEAIHETLHGNIETLLLQSTAKQKKGPPRQREVQIISILINEIYPKDLKARTHKYNY